MTGPYDVEVDGSFGHAAFGTKSLRISDAVTSGSFGDWVFTKPLTDAVGEVDSTDGAFSRGTLQSHFETQFDIASTVPSAQQPGLHVSVSPDRGDGSRMSYLRFEDSTGGIDVFFDDVQQPSACTPSGCANFVETPIGTDLTRTSPHTIRLTMDLLDGPGNDVVKVWIDGTLVHTGTSWEDYFRYDPESIAEQSPRIVRNLIIQSRTGGGPVTNPANADNGFLFDNISLSSGPIPVDPFAVPVACSDIAFSGAPIVGTNGSDSINGTSGNDLIFALGGSDVVNGGGGNDCIVGGMGSDSLRGGNGNDVILGGDGSDSLDGGNNEDKLYGEDGVDSLKGGNHNDELHGGNDGDSLNGGNGNDTLFGDSGNDSLRGDTGKDTLAGGDGADFANGGAGNQDACTAEFESACEL